MCKSLEGLSIADISSQGAGVCPLQTIGEGIVHLPDSKLLQKNKIARDLWCVRTDKGGIFPFCAE